MLSERAASPGTIRLVQRFIQINLQTARRLHHCATVESKALPIMARAYGIGAAFQHAYDPRNEIVWQQDGTTETVKSLSE